MHRGLEYVVVTVLDHLEGESLLRLTFAPTQMTTKEHENPFDLYL